MDHARSLELKLEAARAEAAELGLRLSAAEGRAQGLEAELARVETQRRAAEAQLGGLRSALRRGLGLGGVSSPAPRPAPVSPNRSAPVGGERARWRRGGPVGGSRRASAPTLRPHVQFCPAYEAALGLARPAPLLMTSLEPRPFS